MTVKLIKLHNDHCTSLFTNIYLEKPVDLQLTPLSQ